MVRLGRRGARREPGSDCRDDGRRYAGGLGTLDFKRELTPARRAVLAEWVDYARATDSTVSKSDFEAWYSDEHKDRGGYNAGSFWEIFAKAIMKQSDRFRQPNARAYRYAGDTTA